jgi:hypothetical protein
MNRLALLATVAILVSVGGAGAQAAPSTGLTGKVLRGPTTPVCRADTPCYAPFKGTLVFTRITTGAVTFAPVRTQTEENGHYKVLLDPARYRVTLPTTSRWRGAVKPAVVTVSKGVMRRVNLVVDTGIR